MTGVRVRGLHALALVVMLLAPAPARAQVSDSMQAQIRSSQERLAEIRAERERLQQEMQSLVGRARNMSSELANIERQVTLSASALRELDEQTAALASSVNEITQQLLLTRDRLRERQVVLSQRLRDIYKQGPLHAVRVLLSSQSFGDLMNRYKYLHLISVHDRMLLQEVTELEHALVQQEADLRLGLAQIERLREDKQTEFAQLQYLEQQQARSLETVQQRVSQTDQQIRQLEEDERRLTSLIDDLERRRIEAERRRAAAGVATTATGALSASDLGTLPWPVDGELLYRFGPERMQRGVVITRHGIGIKADPGTPVRAVRGGTVEMARRIDGWGNGVVVSHGAGYYSMYLYLGEIGVQEGQDISAGQVVGAVGAQTREHGPHLFFRIQVPVAGGSPVPVDPLPWLRPRQ